uniref:Aminotransferase-like plant mobile domain-containing protein n=1 Tax=Fagus sylvatica TaxID=28930 RepID=A0A2N9HDV5_FAGSY
MASSSSTTPVSPPLQLSIGEGLETSSVVPAVSTEAMVDASAALSTVLGEAMPAAPSSIPDETENLREGFVSPLEILDSDFWDSLRDAGVHWSILISRSYNMFRDTEPLREMLPILGEHSLSNIKLSAEEVEIAVALRKQSSTRLSGWPSFFVYHKEVSVRRAAFVLYWLSAWARFSDLPREFLDRFPNFRNNLPLVYRWVGLKTRDYDLVDTLDHEENVLFRPYGDDYPGFTCISVFSRLYQPISSIRDLKIDDYRSLSYLSTVNPGFLPVLSATGVSFIPYCPQRVQRQFGLDQGVPVGPQETATCVADLTAFIRSRAFARWGGETNRVMIPSGHRLDFNTSSMNAYWQRLTQSMVEFVNAGRSDKTPMSVHHKPLVSNLCLASPSQSAISYANSQKLRFAEWDGVRGGWIAYTIHLPESWRNSVNVVEDRLIMPSKHGKGSKRDALVDLAVEKTPKKPTPSIHSSKKAPSKKTKAGKKGKSTLLVSPPAKKSTTAPVEEPTESTVAPSKIKSVSASPSKKSGKKSAASRPSKGQEKTSVFSSSLDEEQPSAALTLSPSKKKKSVAPFFPLGAASCTRSKNGSKATRGSGRSSGDVVVVEDSDMVVDDVVASPLEGDDLQTTAVDEGKDLRKSVADSPEVGAESTGGGHFSSSDSFFDSAPGSVLEEQIMSAGSTADDDDMPGADDSSMGPADPMGDDLAIVPHASHGRDDDSAVDADVDPISFSVPQTVLTSRFTGPDASMAYIMEGISLFGATPSIRAIPAGGFVISANRLTSEAPPVAGGAFIPEEIRAQGLIESESVVDLGVSTADHGAQVEDAGVSAVDTLAGSDHLENIVSVPVDLVVALWRVSAPMDLAWMIPYICRKILVKWESPVRSQLLVHHQDPSVGAGSSVGIGSLSSEVADFLKEFDRKAPNPHPEQFFWRFNGPLVPFGSFWVPNDCLPYLLRLSAGRSDFTTNFKLSAGLGGPMLSLLGSVLAAMSESSLEDVTKTRILAWRSVIQDLMEVGFDLGFMIERLRQTAQCFFGKRISDEVEALKHQIALLQDSLAVLTAYQDEMVSTGRMILGTERGGSFLDSLLD